MIEVLLVEDNPADQELAKEALSQGDLVSSLRIVSDGEQAVQFLHQKGAYQAEPRPNLILLDLNLPRKNGLEVLQEIKQDESLKSIPVIVLTTSSSEQDIVESYGAYANCYLNKPVEFDEFLDTVRSIEYFWLTLAKLPGNK